MVPVRELSRCLATSFLAKSTTLQPSGCTSGKDIALYSEEFPFWESRKKKSVIAIIFRNCCNPRVRDIMADRIRPVARNKNDPGNQLVFNVRPHIQGQRACYIRHLWIDEWIAASANGIDPEQERPFGRNRTDDCIGGFARGVRARNGSSSVQRSVGRCPRCREALPGNAVH